LQVIIDVAPEELRSNMLIGTLKGALFAISSHHCGNYVVQALISSAKTADQVYRKLHSEVSLAFC
jgi:nucleolar protein 9